MPSPISPVIYPAVPPTWVGRLVEPRDERATPFGNVRSSEPINAAFSPDGGWVTYSSTEDGRRILVQPFPATGALYEIPTASDVNIYPRWSPDGHELLWAVGYAITAAAASATGKFSVVSVTTSPRFTFGSPVVVPTGGLQITGPSVPRTYDLLPDGRIVGMVAAGASNRTAASSVLQVQVVLGWFEELRRLVPTP